MLLSSSLFFKIHNNNNNDVLILYFSSSTAVLPYLVHLLITNSNINVACSTQFIVNSSDKVTHALKVGNEVSPIYNCLTYTQYRNYLALLRYIVFRVRIYIILCWCPPVFIRFWDTNHLFVPRFQF